MVTIDSSHTIQRAVKLFFSGTALSRITGMLRDVTMAFVFGSHPMVAAFMMAFRFSNLFRRIFGDGAMQSAFVPLFEELRRDKEERAFHFFKEIASLLTLLLLFIVLIVEGALLGGSLLFHPSLDNLEIIQLTAIMFPGLIFICLYSLNASLLQCQGHFFLSSVAPVGFNIVWIIAVLICYGQDTKSALFNLSIAIVAAYFFQWIITLPKMMTYFTTSMIKKKVSLFSLEIKRLGKPLLLGIIGVSATQINSTVDPLFARAHDLEGPAYLWYAIRLQQLPLALLGIAFSGALLPALSRAVKSLDMSKYSSLMHYGLKKSLHLMIPITFMSIAIGSSSVLLLYGRGDFSDIAVKETTYCLLGYSMGIVPSTLVFLFSAAACANNRFANPAKAAFYSMILNVILNGCLIFFFQLGSASIALATSIAAFFNAYVLLGSIPLKEDWSQNLEIIKVTLVSFASALCTLLLGAYFFDDQTTLLFFQNNSVVFSRNFLSQLGTFGAMFSSFCFFYILGAKWAKLTDQSSLLNAFFTLIKRKKSQS